MIGIRTTRGRQVLAVPGLMPPAALTGCCAAASTTIRRSFAGRRFATTSTPRSSAASTSDCVLCGLRSTFYYSPFILCPVSLYPFLSRASARARAKFWTCVMNESGACTRLLQRAVNEIQRCVDEINTCVGEIYRCVDGIHTCIDEIHTCIDEIHTCIDEIHTCIDEINTCIDEINTCIDEINRCIDEINTLRLVPKLYFGMAIVYEIAFHYLKVWYSPPGTMLQECEIQFWNE